MFVGVTIVFFLPHNIVFILIYHWIIVLHGHPYISSYMTISTKVTAIVFNRINYSEICHIAIK